MSETVHPLPRTPGQWEAFAVLAERLGARYAYLTGETLDRINATHRARLGDLNVRVVAWAAGARPQIVLTTDPIYFPPVAVSEAGD